MNLKESLEKTKEYFKAKHNLLKTGSSDLPLLLHMCLYLFLGILCAIALDFVWSTLELPGYGYIVFELGMRMDDKALHVGHDEIYGIVVVAIITSYFVGRKKYEVLVTFFGVIGDILITKFTEYLIYPTYFNLLFFGLFLIIGVIGTCTFWLIRTNLKDVLKGFLIWITVWVIFAILCAIFFV